MQQVEYIDRASGNKVAESVMGDKALRFAYETLLGRTLWPVLFGSKATNLQLYNLALDRIVSVEPSEVPFRENPDFDPEHFFDDVIGVSKNINNTPRKIIFWANREQSKYIQTKPIHPTQKIIQENKEDGSCTFSINVVINFEMYSVFMSYGPGIQILRPRNAREYMRDKLKQAASMYEKEMKDPEEGICHFSGIAGQP